MVAVISAHNALTRMLNLTCHLAQEAVREGLEAKVTQASTALDIGTAAGEDTIRRVLGAWQQADHLIT